MGVQTMPGEVPYNHNEYQMVPRKIQSRQSIRERLIKEKPYTQPKYDVLHDNIVPE